MKLKLTVGALLLSSLAACASRGEQPEIVAKPHTKIAKASIIPSRDIPAERLELRPMAATCVPCAR